MNLSRYRYERAMHHQARQAEIIAMGIKPRPKLKGTALGPNFKSKDGKVERTGNPKASVSQKIAKRRKPKQEWRKAT